MTYSFHPDAESEFNEAINFYEKEQKELGVDFLIEVQKTIQRMRVNPKSWTLVSKSIRRALVHRFPFGILYHYNSDSDHIFIVAVMHLHKEPDYWKKRLKS